MSKKRVSRSPSASSLPFERATKRQKISSTRYNQWNTNTKSKPSTHEALQRKQRLQQFLAVKNLASNNDKSESLRKKTVFEATKNKQRKDKEIKAELEQNKKKWESSAMKIQRDLDERLRKKRLEKLCAQKNSNITDKDDDNNDDQNNQDDIDPLEAFMTNLETSNTTKKKKKTKGKQERIYNDESKFDEGDLLIDAQFDFNDDLNSKNKKEIKIIDHTKINYTKIRKDLYVESPEISLMNWNEIETIRKESLNNCKITVSHKKYDIKPIKKWTQCGLSDTILKSLAKYKYTKPFAVQCQAIPVIMSGRDVICVASTGSGKTLAYILPLIRHVLAIKDREHISSLILCPTRELAKQIGIECNKFLHSNRIAISVCSIYGGVSITEQINGLRRGCDVIIATPGRLIELLCINNHKLLDIKYVSYFVLDEADRLFDLGFESQISSILDSVRPDKQLLMFSATFPKKISKIAIGYFGGKNNSNLVQITIGSPFGVAPSMNVAQFVYIMDNCSEKFKCLLRLLGEWYGRGNILIFVDIRENVDILFSELCDSGYFSLILHGGINQIDRDYTMIDFKTKSKTILICTSIASRGLDVTDLLVVINYYPPHHYEDYIHRIGRTGRGNNRGVAYTLLNRENMKSEQKCVPHIIKAMKKSNMEIDKELMDLEQEYYNELNCGNETMHRNSGYNGKGYKYDKAEQNVKKKEIERQKYVYGAKEELTEWNLNNLNRADDIKQILPADNKKSINIEDSTDPLSRNIETLKKALMAAKKKKKEIDKKKKKKKINLDENTSAELIQKTINRTIEREKKKQDKETRERVESIARFISREIGAEESIKNNNENNVFKLDINDYPPNARKVVTYKQTLNPLKENYNVRITQKGTFVPAGRKPPKGQESLYLEIQGKNISDIHAAIKELKEVLHQQSQKGQYMYNQYAKYKVV